jgi:hypothetical protein
LVKKVNIKSIKSCVEKQTTANKPKSVYEMPYTSRKVTNKSGDILETTANAIFEL